MLGSGAADGWPNPFCHCASCEAARVDGEVRGHTAALIDGRILLDLGPDVPRSAERCGVSLGDVDLILLTHAHPDHVHGLLLLARTWAAASPRLTIAGPQAALDEVAHWLDPSGDVNLHALAPDDVMHHHGYVVRALAAQHDEAPGNALLFDVTDPAGAALLYATDTGIPPAATVASVAERAFDIALIEETFGERTDHRTDHLDLTTFPRAIAALRSNGALVDASQVFAVHLSHYNPPPSQLRRVLSEWGVQLPRDGERLSTTTDSPRRPNTTHRTLILGGARSGKSAHAERILADRDDVAYIATAAVIDPEMQERVDRHRERRPDTWSTQETLGIEQLLRNARPGDHLLIDCLTLWLTRVMDEAGCWENGELREVDNRIDGLVDAWRTTRARVVAVSNEVGNGVVPATASGRLFRDVLGMLNTRIAANSDDVLLTVAGQVQVLRGKGGQ